MDSRCYFSSTWWRSIKQVAVDAVKQKVRHGLLATGRRAPLMTSELFEGHCRVLIGRLSALAGGVHVLGLLPISDVAFPGSAEQFERINEILRGMAQGDNVDSLDWGGESGSMHVKV